MCLIEQEDQLSNLEHDVHLMFIDPVLVAERLVLTNADEAFGARFCSDLLLKIVRDLRVVTETEFHRLKRQISDNAFEVLITRIAFFDHLHVFFEFSDGNHISKRLLRCHSGSVGVRQSVSSYLIALLVLVQQVLQLPDLFCLGFIGKFESLELFGSLRNSSLQLFIAVSQCVKTFVDFVQILHS